MFKEKILGELVGR